MTTELEKENLLKGHSPLLKLSLDDRQKLRVSENSLFSDQTWNFNFHGEYVNLNFGNSEWASFYKCIAYPLLPDKPYNESVTSIQSVKTKLGRVKLFTRTLKKLYIIQPNELPLVTVSQLRTGFTHQLTSRAKSHASSYLDATNIWLDLSTRGILPTEFSSNIDPPTFYENLEHNIDDVDSIPWTPISGDHLEYLWGEVKLWVENRSEDLIKISHIINERTGNRGTKVSSEIGKKLLAYQFSEENGKPWFNFQITQAGRKDKRLVQIGELTKGHFYRLRAYCVFVILLLTGMRILELSCLEKGCCTRDAGSTDKYTLRFRRFKTARDSSVGEEDTIPVPEIVFKAIAVVESLDHMGLDGNFLFSSKKGKFKRLSRKAHYVTLKRHLNIHPHQARKTISWLLISRDEENIDLVRELLGHKSFKMTLRYILSNHDLMETTKSLFQNHYLSEFTDLIGSIIEGKYSGKAAEKLADHLRSTPELNVSNLVDTSLEEFIKATLEGGNPLFLRRTPVGAYCLVQRSLSGTATPCTAGRPPSAIYNPIVTNCKYDECPHSALVEGCIPNVERDISFIKKRLEAEIPDKRVLNAYTKSLEAHLRNLTTPRPILGSQKDE
jgi:hypothetical protein